MNKQNYYQLRAERLNYSKFEATYNDQSAKQRSYILKKNYAASQLFFFSFKEYVWQYASRDYLWFMSALVNHCI